jgi:2-polyprenyl-3-methyl-5-hydroxy-6-metoxy-1,4-benzoquinol methylase
MNRDCEIVLQERLEEFFQLIPVKRLSEELASCCGMPEDEAELFLSVYANEMRITLDLIGEKIKPGIKMLEVGAGLCLFSVFLKKQGYDITALEPSTGGFGKFEIAKQVILDAYADLNLRVLESPAQSLSDCNDRFDLIFSNNVLEHIPNLEEAWLGMCTVLKPDGVMAHNCPNYFFPYEPHLGIPIFKSLPWLSAIFFPRSVAQYREVWESLNFITYFDARKLASVGGMEISFKSGLLFEALNRMERDPFFRERHSGSVIFVVYTILCKTGLLRLLKHIPPVFSTPMIFHCSRKR